MAIDPHLEIIYKIIDEIVKRRKQLRISHEKLASEVGLDRSTISLIESKKRIPSILNIYKICKALGLSLGVLIQNESLIKNIEMNTNSSMDNEDDEKV